MKLKRNYIIIQKFVCLFLLLLVIVQSKAAIGNQKLDPGLNKHPHIIVSPISPGGIISTAFSLTVNGIRVPIEKIEKFSAVPVHYALIESDGVKKLNFELKTSIPISKYSISPKRKNILSHTKANKLNFSINTPQYIVVQIAGMDDLFILIDSINNHSPKIGDANVKNILDYDGIDNTGKMNSSVAINKAIRDIAASNTSTILYFPPGKYLSKQINMKSNVTIYLAAGALIQATDNKDDYPNKGIIYWDHVSNSKLFGRGIIDGNGRTMTNGSSVHIIKANLSHDCIIEGILERDSPFWTNHIYKCNYFQYKNIKIINYRPKIKVDNTDGLNFDCSSNCGLYNGFFYTGDDNCVVKGTSTGSAYNVHNIVFDKYIGYSNSAACKIGTETTIDSITNITFKNVDIIRCDRALAIDAFDNAKIKSVNFQNINIETIAPNGEGNEVSKFIDFEVTNTGWRKSDGTTSIKNIKVKNVFSYVDVKKYPSTISAVSKLYDISGLIFQNLSAKNDAGKEQLIQNSSQGNIRIGAFVYNIRFMK
jgi:hypothetical protein